MSGGRSSSNTSPTCVCWDFYSYIESQAGWVVFRLPLKQLEATGET